MNPFELTELTKHILSFVPRDKIINCLLVNKTFYELIPIDYDQESVGRNGDMFSLTKIIYSSKIVFDLAVEFNHNIMINYLTKHHKIKYAADTYMNLGYSGNETLIDDMINKLIISDKTQQVLFIVSGICLGNHVNLFDLYIGKIFKIREYHNYDLYTLLKPIYYTNCIELKNKLKPYMIKYNFPKTLRKKVKIISNCSNKSSAHVNNFILKLINEAKIIDHIHDINEGLVKGNHYDIYIWLEEKYTKHLLNDNMRINTGLIYFALKNNNLQFFRIILEKYYAKHGENDVKKKFLKFETVRFPLWIEYKTLANICIEFRRSEMLKLVIKYGNFNEYDYDNFLENAIKYNNMIDVIRSNEHMFHEINRESFLTESDSEPIVMNIDSDSEAD